MTRHSARFPLFALTALAAGAALVTTGCSADGTNSAGSGAGSQTVAHRGSVPDPSPRDTSAPQEESAPAAAKAQPSPSGGDPAPAKVPWCTSDALSPSLHALEPAAGNRYSALVLTNTSASACRTQGWPGLQLTGEAGVPMPTDAVRDRSRAPQALTLGAGEKAWSRLHWSVVAGEQDPADGTCPSPVAVRVIAPDRHTPADADWGGLGSVCSGGRIDVQPLQPGGGSVR